jgi:hypothetical protein
VLILKFYHWLSRGRLYTKSLLGSGILALCRECVVESGNLYTSWTCLGEVSRDSDQWYFTQIIGVLGRFFESKEGLLTLKVRFMTSPFLSLIHSLSLPHPFALFSPMRAIPPGWLLSSLRQLNIIDIFQNQRRQWVSEEITFFTQVSLNSLMNLAWSIVHSLPTMLELILLMDSHGWLAGRMGSTSDRS